MPRIQLLPETLANQIAAGEVIERPAAVVKELVENALDAGARHIEIDLLDGGRKLVRVKDDGCGMSREDAELSLQRHATSKLRTKEDLFAIASYGFRGEALPSMAAVSRFTLVTCERDALKGTRIDIEGGKIVNAGDAGAPAGTTVEVRDLFWNVPARRKFLKRAQTEHAQCIDALLRLALPRPDAAFAVREKERPILQLPAASADARVEEAFGREVRGKLIAFESQVRGVKARGLAVSPSIEYGSARNVWLFVNGRAIRDRALTHAVLRAYGELMPHGRYPGAAVFLEVPPAEVDVNVHPAKAEVRLADPRAAWDAIFSGLTSVLSRGAWVPSAPMPERPWAAARVAEPLELDGPRAQPHLIAPAPYFHDQRLRKAAAQPAQPLLVPHIVQLPPAAAARIAEAAPLLAEIGVEVDSMGGASAAVKALPKALAQLDERTLPALLSDLAEELGAHGRGESLERLRDALLARAACHGSVRAHDALAPGEAQALLDALDQTDYGARCAHGRPVVAEWSEAEIERRFGRDYASHPHAAPPEAL